MRRTERERGESERERRRPERLTGHTGFMKIIIRMANQQNKEQTKIIMSTKCPEIRERERGDEEIKSLQAKCKVSQHKNKNTSHAMLREMEVCKQSKRPHPKMCKTPYYTLN